MPKIDKNTIIIW